MAVAWLFPLAMALGWALTGVALADAMALLSGLGFLGMSAMWWHLERAPAPHGRIARGCDVVTVDRDHMIVPSDREGVAPVVLPLFGLWVEHVDDTLVLTSGTRSRRIHRKCFADAADFLTLIRALALDRAPSVLTTAFGTPRPAALLLVEGALVLPSRDPRVAVVHVPLSRLEIATDASAVRLRFDGEEVVLAKHTFTDRAALERFLAELARREVARPAGYRDAGRVSRRDPSVTSPTPTSVRISHPCSVTGGECSLIAPGANRQKRSERGSNEP